MAKRDLEIIGKIARFTMSVKGGKLRDGFEAIIPVEMGFTGATEGQLFECCASGQSARVALQGQLRGESEQVLNGYAAGGYKCKFTDILSGKPPKTAKDMLLALSKEDFIELMCDEYDLSTDRAEVMYNLKHEIKVE